MGALNATGVWTEVNYGQKAIFSSASPDEININKNDKEVLKNLADKVHELAIKEKNLENKRLWYDHNDLKLKQPLIFCLSLCLFHPKPSFQNDQQ